MHNIHIAEFVCSVLAAAGVFFDAWHFYICIYPMTSHPMEGHRPPYIHTAAAARLIVRIFVFIRFFFFSFLFRLCLFCILHQVNTSYVDVCIDPTYTICIDDACIQ